MRYWFAAVLVMCSSVAFAISDSALNAGAKGAVAGAAMGIIGGLGVLMWIGIRWVQRRAIPKAREVIKTSSQAVVHSAKEFQDRNKTCPFCAETIKKDAVVCKHCQRSL